MSFQPLSNSISGFNYPENYFFKDIKLKWYLNEISKVFSIYIKDILINYLLKSRNPSDKLTPARKKKKKKKNLT